jgi:hypothetical protein
MVKRSLDGYMPGQRSASTSRCATPTRSSSPQTTQQAHRRRSSNTADFASWGDQQQQQQQQQKQEPATVGHRKRAPPRQQPEHSQACPARRCGGHDADQAAAPSSTASGAWSDVSSVEQHQHQGLDLMEVEAPTLLPGPGGEACSIEGGGVIGSSRKRSRLAASSFTLQVMQVRAEHGRGQRAGAACVVAACERQGPHLALMITPHPWRHRRQMSRRPRCAAGARTRRPTAA